MQENCRDAAPDAPSVGLDSFDLAILNLVQENNRLSSQQIGAQIGLSASSVQRRLRRLHEVGVIVADVSLIAPAAAGNRVTVIVEVSLEREQLQQREEFERSVRTLPEVVQCYYVTGNSNYVLILNLKTMEDFSKFTDEVFFSNPNIKQISYCGRHEADQIHHPRLVRHRSLKSVGSRRRVVRCEASFPTRSSPVLRGDCGNSAATRRASDVRFAFLCGQAARN
jgi:Lrp/AsnC family leucine-responsive transcriptional regulator